MLRMVIVSLVVVRHVSLLSDRQGCGFRGFHFQGRRPPLSRPWLAPLLLGVALLLPPAPAQAATVVAADGVLCDLTRTLADGLITVVCLLPASQDPHQARCGPAIARFWPSPIWCW